MRLAYLYSRYPVISQTFCDAEMLALERRGIELVIGSVYPPLTSLRHEYIAKLQAPIHYAPPQEILKILERNAKATRKWPRDLVEQHEAKYGLLAKAELRARNALHFAGFFERSCVDHVHVHFANRAAHTALFVKEISGIPFSVTAHGQDFMKDLGSDDLLREICASAEFVAAETDYSRDLLRQRCPNSAAKIHRIYNGIDLERFPELPVQTTRSAVPPHPPRIVSIGRLVAFKGFEDLIDSCAELACRQIDFVCDIIGGGPLREKLQARIEQLHLGSRVNLLGSLSQDAVLEKLQAADIFALASTTDEHGATDVFPTVILEAMAAARPVVSTHLAGIPELIVDRQTGIMAPAGDSTAFARALEELLRDPELQLRFGRAGRKRIEQYFRIEQTVAPLVEMFENIVRKHWNIDFQSVPTAPKAFEAAPAPVQPESTTVKNLSVGQTNSPGEIRLAANKMHIFRPQAITIMYLIDRWPDRELPLLEREIEQMKHSNVPIHPVVCELNSDAKFTPAAERVAPLLEFLPDAMALEAEWRTNPALAQQLEEERAQQSSRAPGAIFLRQGRFALVLRRLIQEKNISHIHATSSRALVCAIMLKKLLNVTVSATIEPHSGLSREWIQNALSQCVGGRLSSRKLLEQYCRGSVSDATAQPRRFTAVTDAKQRPGFPTPYKESAFIPDKTTFHSAPQKMLRRISQRTRIDLTTGSRFWQQWAELLLRWSSSDGKSKIPTP